MRHEYCEKNEIIITYSDTDVIRCIIDRYKN